MKKHFVLYSIAALSVFLFACKDNNNFTISGTISNPGSLKKVYLLAADSSQVAVVDSTNIGEQGKFQFKRPAPYANLYKLRVGGAIFDMIAKNGDAITFSTDIKDAAHGYKVSGSDDSEKIQEFNKISNVYSDKSAKITQEYQDKAAALGKQSDSLIKIYMPVFQKNMGNYSDAVLKFVNENKTSLAGFYAATSLDPTKYEQQLIAYADAIKDDFKSNPGVQQFVKQMMIAKPISIGHKAPDFSVVGIDGKLIKLSDYKGKYVMLDFWASWCAPCRAENPNVVKQYAIYQPKGLNILGISLDTDKSLNGKKQ